MASSFVVKVLGIMGAVSLLLMLNLTSPMEIGPLGVLVFFTTLYITIFSIFSLSLSAFYKLAFSGVMRRKDYLASAVFAFGPIMILIARAFSAINLWTLMLIALFLILAEFLVYKKA